MEGREEGREEGRQEGKEEGLLEGLEKGKIEVARRLLARGMVVEEAAEISGISVEVLRGAVGKA